MKLRIILALTGLFIGSVTASAQEDAERCKDPAMFPNRMANYILSECKSNYDAVNFNLAADEEKMVSKEGTKTFIRYDFNFEAGGDKPSGLQILRNYENAAKKIGATTVFLRVEESIGVFKIMKGGKDVVWIKVQSGGSDNNDFYEVTILELEAMNQEISSNDILTTLNTDGHIALYINFETGKADIKTESQNTIDQIAEMLKANAALKISIEGHTDNAGNAASNKALSENRAKSVMNALIAKGIDKARLSSKGWGDAKPVAENTTEDGMAKNRRVEIVKI